jgi:hypothetical protein
VGWFDRMRGRDGATEDDGDHAAPIEIDLGMQKSFEVEMVVGKLESEGCRVYLVAQNEIAKPSDLWPKHCRVLVAAADEARVREELTEAGFL